MSHFAKIVDGKVVQVIVAEADFFTNFVDSSPGAWIQTSYNTRGGKHYGADGKEDSGLALRGNYAGLGYTYDAKNDVFYASQPFPSWVLNESTWTWEAPTPMPTDGKVYSWDEATKTWVAAPTPTGSATITT
jgi:hypothetical protein